MKKTKKQNKFPPKITAFYRLKMGYGCQGIEQCHQLWEADDLASSPALSLSLPACILSFWGGQFPVHTEKPVAAVGNNRPQCSSRVVDPFISSSRLLPWTEFYVLRYSFELIIYNSPEHQPFSHFCCPATTALDGKMANWDTIPAKWQERFKKRVHWTLNILPTTLQLRQPWRKHESYPRHEAAA